MSTLAAPETPPGSIAKGLSTGASPAPSAPEAAADTHVAVRGITKRFGDFQALAGIDLAARRGELVTLLGPSGCGKTTLLRTVAGFLRQDSGQIAVGGEVIDHLPPHRRNFGMVFQSYAIFPHLSVKENVAYGLRARGVPEPEIRERVARALDGVKLGALADRFPDAMSGGQKQRVGLARALVIRPELLLMDEPLSNLDAKLRIAMREEIRLMQKEAGITTLYVTHDQEEAMAISDRVAVMDKGVLQQVATPEVVYDDPANAFVADFIGGCNWFAGRLVTAEGGLHLAIDGEAPFPVVARPGARPGPEAVRIGLRTEDVALSGEGPAIHGRVLIRSYLGHRTRLRLQHRSGVAINVDLPSGPGLPGEGDEARLVVPAHRARAFSAEDGRRLV